MDFETRRAAAFLAAVVFASSRAAYAHHEALFGPQSSLAVESEGFVSLQAHEHVFGVGDTYDQETNYILSGGFTPFRKIPWSLTLVQSFTYENARTPQGEQTGPLSSCGGCFAIENVLLSTSYRIDIGPLQRATGKDGNFALVSAALEPPTGNKDYAPFQGPVNGIFAAMLGFEWRAFAAVGLGYYRLNAIDGAGAKKGNNWLVGLGVAWTPIDHPSRLVSFQIGLAAEVHDPDVVSGSATASGGWEIFASPTIVWAASRHTRFFVYFSIPVAQDCRADYQVDQFRAGLGVIYSFTRTEQHHGS